MEIDRGRMDSRGEGGGGGGERRDNEGPERLPGALGHGVESEGKQCIFHLICGFKKTTSNAGVNPRVPPTLVSKLDVSDVDSTA